MSFIKQARVQSLGTALYAADGSVLNKVANHETRTQPKSYYIDGARKLDVKDALNRVAERYNISSDPPACLPQTG